MANNKSYGALAAMAIAIVFGAVGVATPEWTVNSDTALGKISSGVFRNQIFDSWVDNDLTGCSGSTCEVRCVRTPCAQCV